METQNDKNHNLQYDNIDLQVYDIDYQRNNDCKAQGREAVRKRKSKLPPAPLFHPKIATFQLNQLFVNKVFQGLIQMAFRQMQRIEVCEMMTLMV